MDARALPDLFDTGLVLRSDLLDLRPMRGEDRAALTKAAADPGIWAGHPIKGRHLSVVFEPYFDMPLAAGGTYVARDRRGRVIGMSRYYASADAPGGIGIGFTFLVRDNWGGSTNFEMKRLMLGHIFKHVEDAWFHIAPSNLRSQGATAKLGAERAENRVLDLGSGPTAWVRMRLTRTKWAEVCAARTIAR